MTIKGTRKANPIIVVTFCYENDVMGMCVVPKQNVLTKEKHTPKMHAMALNALSLSHIGRVCVDKTTSSDPRTGYLDGSDLLHMVQTDMGCKSVTVTDAQVAEGLDFGGRTCSSP